jgi:hypothetical protein
MKATLEASTMNPNPPKEDDPKHEEEIDYLAGLHPRLRQLAIEQGNTKPQPFESLVGEPWPEEEAAIDFDAWLRDVREGRFGTTKYPHERE